MRYSNAIFVSFMLVFNPRQLGRAVLVKNQQVLLFRSATHDSPQALMSVHFRRGSHEDGQRGVELPEQSYEGLVMEQPKVSIWLRQCER